MSDMEKKRDMLLRLLEKKQIEISKKDIAVIGLSGLYPGAKTTEDLWKIVSNGKNKITEIPPDRWDVNTYYDPDPEKASKGKMYCKWGGFIDDAYMFDPLLFNISPRNAETTDPQVRKLLETTWTTLEDAGHKPLNDTPQNIGVFMGVTSHTYNTMLFEENLKGNHVVSSANIAAITNLISYFFNFTGPSIPIDTECSSSLTAIHLACKSIQNGECEMALAGGVNLYLHPAKYIALSQVRILSQDEKSRSFGKGGTGFVPGEGVGAVLLKPLPEAVRYGDHIYGVIKGSAINNWGRSSIYMSPNPASQSDLIISALNDANVHPETISYIEAQGMGSDISDTAEISSLTKAYRHFMDRDNNYSCPLGAVKPNIGHPEAASGILQLTKVLLQLKHKKLAPSLNSEELNPNIDFENSPFYIQHRLSEWKQPVIKENGRTKQYRRRAGISSFGSGGTGAHLIIEEFEPPLFVPGTNGNVIIPLSAANEERLKEYAIKLVNFLKDTSFVAGEHLPGIGYTLQAGRTAMRQRLAAVVSDLDELVEKLEKYCQGVGDIKNFYIGNVKKTDKYLESAPVKKGDKLSELARLWVSGRETDWNSLYPDSPPRKIPLPTYPFERRRCRINGDQAEYTHHKAENKVQAIYTYLEKFREEYLTFCPFEEKISGFSMSGIFLNPEKFPEEQKLLKTKQVEMRQILFCKENFDKITAVLDIGCGHGTDVIQIAKTYPHIRTHGFTITKAQAELGNKRISETNLSARSKIFNKDSSKDSFPDLYDLIIGIEVCCHIDNKPGLFQNISSSLREGGRVLLMDFIANLRGSIVDSNVGVSIPTVNEWTDILSENNLLIHEITDVSPQIANFLYDPEIEKNTKDVPEVVRDLFRNHANCSVSLEKGWISYCLFKLEKNTKLGEQELESYNLRKIDDKKPYSLALEEMLSQDNIPYPKIAKDSDPAQTKRDITDNHDHIRKSSVNISHSPVPEDFRQHKISEPDDIKKKLFDIFHSVTGLSRKEIRDAADFSEMGITSLNAVELLEAVNTKFDTRLPTSALFDYNSLESFVKHIAENMCDSEKKRIEKQYAHKKDWEIAAHGKNCIKETSDCIIPQKVQRQKPQTKPKRGTLRSEPVAIVGISGKFPMAENVQEFWNNLAQGKDCITEIPKDRWDWKEFCGDPAKEKNKTDIRWGGFINGTDEFDPMFFGISPGEAEVMDPQQRLLMLYVWKALEDAGICPEKLAESNTGVFVAMTASQYLSGFSISDNPFAINSVYPAMTPNRISYMLNLRGPSEYCDTACSSTLVALHRAVNTIRSGESEQAIVGAVYLSLCPAMFNILSSIDFLSKNGKAKSFQADADGSVISEGVGAVIIKPLQKAINDNDRIYAVIRDIGVSHGGKGISLTAPTGKGMKAAIRHAYKNTGINPETVSYIEANGTATPLGDAVEIDALKSGYKETAKTYQDHFQTESSCYISSLKPSIGHAGTASGMASLIKVLMAFNNKIIPGVPGFTNLNKNISFKGSRFKITAENQKWKALITEKGEKLPRRAAINNYGFDGVNAHALIEEYVDQLKIDNGKLKIEKPYIFVLSAKNEERLKAYAVKMKNFFTSSFDIAEIAYTSQVGREAMEERAALIVNSVEDLNKKLESFIAGQDDIKDFYRGGVKRNKDMLAILEGDEEFGETVDKWIQRGKYPKLLGLWVKGLVFDWNKLYGENKPERVSLPTYPFEKRRCWLETSDKVKEEFTGKTKENIADKQKDVGAWLKGIICSLLKLSEDEIESDQEMSEFGFDSLVGTRLINRIKDAYDIKIQPAILMKYNTIEKLGQYLTENTDLEQAQSKDVTAVNENPEYNVSTDELLDSLLNQHLHEKGK